jgi:hypothetical protein
MASESQSVQWRGEYRAKRYMEHVSVAELYQRAADLMMNLSDPTGEGGAGLVAVEGVGEQWWRKWTHVLEEVELRVPPEYRALADQQEFLLKLGKRAHMEAMFEAGTIQISPASAYGDSSLNAAVHDDELSFESIALPGVQLFVSTTAEGPRIPVEGIHTLRTKSTLQTDFFVYCTTMAASPRLFGDFRADACVAITKPQEFVDRLVAALQPVLPDFQVSGGPVTYADPHDGPRNVVIAITKHFKFSYQHEHRGIWVPRTARMDLQPFFVNLGSLHDCAKLITLTA